MHEQTLLGGYINKGSKAFIPMRGASSIHRRRHDPAVLGPAPTTQRIRFETSCRQTGIDGTGS
jgi:hypothetical protein